jgi:hypothetical protein
MCGRHMTEPSTKNICAMMLDMQHILPCMAVSLQDCLVAGYCNNMKAADKQLQ